MIITSKINMDLSVRGVMPRVDAVQDDKYSRNLEITLYENGVAWTPPSGTAAIVRYKKSDGTGGNYDVLPDGTSAYTISGNVLTVALAPQVCTAPGMVRLAVGLLHGDAEINTFSVKIDVQPNPGIDVVSEDYTNMSNYLRASGWDANMYLGTDEEGNVVAVEKPEAVVQTVNGIAPDEAGNVEIEIPEGTGLTEEQEAKLEAITVTEDGYTDISGVRKATDISAVRDGQTITITTTLQGDVTHTDVISLDDNDYPVTIVSDGVECSVTWEGF